MGWVWREAGPVCDPKEMTVSGIRTVCCGLLAVVMMSCVVAAETDRVDLIRSFVLDAGRGGCLVVAHRAHHAVSPENSLGAIEDAVAIGAHMVELDVRKSADGVYVLMHDGTVDRTTTGEGKVSAMTLAELRGLQLMHANRPTVERVPTYREALEAARGRIMINVDLKGGSIREVIQVARAMGVSDHCLFKAKFGDVEGDDARWLRAQRDVIFMPIVETMEDAEASASMGFPAIEVVIRDGTRGGFDAEKIAWFTARGVRVWINVLWDGRLFAGFGDERGVLDPEGVYVALVRDGVGMLQTDVPEVVLGSLRAAGVLVP